MQLYDTQNCKKKKKSLHNIYTEVFENTRAGLLSDADHLKIAKYWLIDWSDQYIDQSLLMSFSAQHF